MRRYDKWVRLPNDSPGVCPECGLSCRREDLLGKGESGFCPRCSDALTEYRRKTKGMDESDIFGLISSIVSSVIAFFNGLSPPAEFFLGAAISLMSLLIGGFFVLFMALLVMFHAFYKNGSRNVG